MGMNLYDQALLENVEKFAAIGLSVDEIQIVTGAVNDDFKQQILDKSTLIGIAYLKGKYKLKVEINTSLKQLAMNGSTPAIEKMIKIIDKQESCE